MKKKKEESPYAAIVADLFKNVRSKEEFNQIMTQLMKEGLETVLRAELDEHLDHDKNQPSEDGNTRNGFSKKTVKGSIGDIALSIPRDRNSTFEPQFVPKHQRMIDKVEDVIIGLYARGMNTRDIEDQIKEIYGIEVSETTVSNVTSRVIEYMKQWQNRPLEKIYFTVWMDALSIKVKENGKVNNKSVYLIIGLNKEGKKEVLGMWINITESASFWMSVLTDLKARGVEDILIACTDNLKGFTEAIKAVFPKTDTQLCIVHQIRNSTRYVVWNDKREFTSDLKEVYNAANKEAAWDNLQVFKEKWGKKYPHAILSWERNWDNLTAFFEYPMEIRKMIYTTNTIESLNSTIRKYTKTKVIFPDDTAALKAIYLSINIIERKWTNQIRNWGVILNQFLIKFEDRCNL
ncbi:MAG TPA: IS256 family transposase [Tissierellaceae bacterium]